MVDRLILLLICPPFEIILVRLYDIALIVRVPKLYTDAPRRVSPQKSKVHCVAIYDKAR